MKAEMKAVVASIVVIALALTAVSGITYSWFSATDNAEIHVTTAKVQYEITGISGDVTNNTDSNTDNKVAVNISNLYGNNTYKIDITMKNTSNIDTVYKVSIKASTSNGFTQDGLKSFSIKDVTSEVESESQSFTEFGKDVVIRDWTEDAAPTTDEGNVITINTLLTVGDLDNVDQSKNITFTITVDAFQGNYPYTTLDNGSALVPSNGAISGTVIATGTSTPVIPVTITLPSTTSDSAATEGKEFKTTISATTEGSDTQYTISATLNDAGAEFTESEPAKMTVTLPGNLLDNDVIYLGTTGDQPTVLSKIYNAGTGGTEGTTTITFTTTHFSDFMVAKGIVAIGENASGANAYTSVSAAVSAGNTKVLVIADSTNESTIAIRNAISINGQGHTIKTNGNGITIEVDNASSKVSINDLTLVDLSSEDATTYGIQSLSNNKSSITLNDVNVTGYNTKGTYIRYASAVFPSTAESTPTMLPRGTSSAML